MAKKDNTKVENKMEAKEVAEKELFENTTEEQNNEMELTLDGDEMEAMEKLAEDKVKQEQKQAQKDKSKRGPKGPRTTDKEKEESKKEKSKPDLNQTRILEREIKKGRVMAPQGRIEKMEDGRYEMKLADGVIFREDAKEFKSVGIENQMEQAKWKIVLKAMEELKTDKFEHKVEGEEPVKHEYVRVELHKPGRDKDVVELYSVTYAKSKETSYNQKEKKNKEEKEKAEEKAKNENKESKEEEKTA